MKNFTRDEFFEGMKQYYLQHKKEPNIVLYPPGSKVDGRVPGKKLGGMLAVETDWAQELHYGHVDGLEVPAGRG